MRNGFAQTQVGSGVPIASVNAGQSGTIFLYRSILFREVKSRLARWQPGIYGIGQILHVSGLAWSGGYQVARKTTAASHSFEQILGMGLMGFGGLISILGGVIFLVVVYRSMRATPDRITAGAASQG